MKALEMKTIHKRLIYTLAIVLPLAVALLTRIQIEGYDFRFLPTIYAWINGLTALLLLAALWAILTKKVKLHERIIELCLILSSIFLVLYVVYHATSAPASYGGSYPLLYYSVLISHIVLSALVVPLVLFAVVYGKEKMLDKHRKIVKIAFPMWLYVAVTGVIVYWMISPFYS